MAPGRALLGGQGKWVVASHIHGGGLLPFRDLSLFLSQLELEPKLIRRVDSRKGTNL